MGIVMLLGRAELAFSPLGSMLTLCCVLLVDHPSFNS
jgi:hypothetical protein